MSTKLFVASLPFEFTDEQLQALFAPQGTVESAQMVMDRKHGRTRGFGFVTMTDDAQAQAAIEKLNGSSVGDRKIWVTVARPERAKPEPRSGRRDFSGERPDRGNERFGRRDRGQRRGPRGGRPFPQDDSQPASFNDLFPPPPAGGDAQPRRPFGRSGRGMDYQGNPMYYGAGGGGSHYSQNRRPGGGARPPYRGGAGRGGAGGGRGGAGGEGGGGGRRFSGPSNFNNFSGPRPPRSGRPGGRPGGPGGPRHRGRPQP